MSDLDDDKTKPIALAVERLYAAFARYPLGDAIDCCPHCNRAQAIRLLYRAPLRALNADDLRIYAFCAITTIGDSGDFRHFLPRVLELLPSESLVDPHVIMGKLRLAGWSGWPADEQAAVREFLYAVWALVNRHSADEVEGWLTGIARLEDDLGPYLSAWRRPQDRFAHEYAGELAEFRPPESWPEDRTEQWRQICHWWAQR